MFLTVEVGSEQGGRTHSIVSVKGFIPSIKKNSGRGAGGSYYTGSCPAFQPLTSFHSPTLENRPVRGKVYVTAH